MKWHDCVSFVGVLLAMLLPVMPRQWVPLATAIALHLILDFTLQSGWACTKAIDLKALVFHSVVVGFLPLAGMGLAAGLPAMALWGGLTGFVTHLVIDGCDKFGLPLWPGLLFDQAFHLLVIVALFWAVV